MCTTLFLEIIVEFLLYCVVYWTFPFRQILVVLLDVACRRVELFRVIFEVQSYFLDNSGFRFFFIPF